MSLKYNILFLLISVLFLVTACEKSPGVGGSSAITGTFLACELDDLNACQTEYALAEERIYIVYGDSTELYDNEVRTDYAGRFEFDFLYEGDYTIYAYNKCTIEDTCNAPVYPSFYPVSINSKNQTVNLGEMTLYK